MRPVKSLSIIFFCLIMPTSALHAQVQENEQNNEIKIPSTVPEIPTPPAVALPNLGTDILNKEPLAWRAKALAMSGEYPFNEKNGTVWVCPLAYKKAQILLKKAINQAGVELICEYPDAGQYLVCSGSDSPEIIIVSQPVNDAKTLFKLRIYSSRKSIQSKNIFSIPQLMKNLLGNPGI